MPSSDRFIAGTRERTYDADTCTLRNVMYVTTGGTTYRPCTFTFSRNKEPLAFSNFFFSSFLLSSLLVPKKIQENSHRFIIYYWVIQSNWNGFYTTRTANIWDASVINYVKTMKLSRALFILIKHSRHYLLPYTVMAFPISSTTINIAKKPYVHKWEVQVDY